MIPKVIHYCWFGRGQMPKLALKCIESWKKYCPDYEIKEWNEDNFDVNAIPYTREAYEARKFAFVSDYARFWILYHHGGLYFDTDVEVIRPFDDIVAHGPFMGCEQDASSGAKLPSVAPGLGLGANPGLGLYKEILDLYGGLHFCQADDTLNLKTVVQYTTELLCQHGLQNKAEIQEVAGVWVYPKEYFNPADMSSFKICVTERTYSIHHYAGSWLPRSKRLKSKFLRLLGPRVVCIYLKFKNFKKTSNER